MQYIKGIIGRVYIVCMKVGESVDRLLLGDRVLLPRRLRVWLPRGRLRSEDRLLEKALLDELLQVFSEGPTVDGLVPLAIMVGAVLLRPRQ